MKLEQQLQEIVNEAPEHGVPSEVVEKAIAPILMSCADQLQKLEYFVLQNLSGEWILTTLVNPSLNQEKRVIYAFVSVQDAAKFQGKEDLDIVAVPITVIQLLFRLFSLQQVDSLIFLENSANLNQGQEIQREPLANSIMSQIKQLKQNNSNIA